MTNKADRLLKNIESYYDKDNYNKILNKVGELEEKPTIKKQAQYINSLLECISENYGGEEARKVMRPCGYHCISNNIINIAKEIYKKSSDVEEFLKLLNDNGIGGGYLHIENNKIIAIYDRCYCGIPKALKTLSPIYCECSGGWFQKLFSSVFEKAVTVKRIDTILNGADKCTFQIE